MSRRIKVIGLLLICIFIIAGLECFSRLERVHVAEEDLTKVYKKVVRLSGTHYIAVDDKGDIHHVQYMPYSDKIIIEYADVTDGMIDWEAFKDEKPKKKVKHVN